ncbi:MAG: RluA family pseudouridine synthase [Leptothrix sp. (in: b-proteobacteria)]
MSASNLNDPARSGEVHPTVSAPGEADDDDLLAHDSGDAAAPSSATADAAAEVECRHAEVDAAGHGERLDRWLVRVAPEFSRSHLQGLIEAGHVRCGAQVLTSASKKVSAGQAIDITLWPTAQSTAFRPEPMALAIVYEDAHLLVINKPAGLVVHPAAGHWSGTLMNGLLAHHAAAAQLPRAGIVHRLDKDTSGLMLVAKSLVAHTALVRAIAAREVRREYLALVHGEVGEQTEVIDAPIGRDPVSRIKMAVVASGKPARTDVTGLACIDLSEPRSIGTQAPHRRVSAVHCRLHSGRTHQIRVHMALRHHPLLADAVYGGAALLGVQRQALHAARLSLRHPVTDAPLRLEAPLPADLMAAWEQVTGSAQMVWPASHYNLAA